jgi:hypothetical protein
MGEQLPERAVRTVPFGGGWANQIAGDMRILSMHESHAEAVFVGSMIARREKLGHVIHGREGTIRERRSHAPARVQEARLPVQIAQPANVSGPSC